MGAELRSGLHDPRYRESDSAKSARLTRLAAVASRSSGARFGGKPWHTDVRNAELLRRSFRMAVAESGW